MKLDAVNNEVAEVKIHYVSKIKPSDRAKITNSQDCVNIFKTIDDYSFNMEFKEMFYAMYVSKANKVLSVLKISEGSSTGTIVDIKQILMGAVLQNAHGIILTHNHPSGNLQPSEQDINITRKVKESARLFNVELMDHIIISQDGAYSFADEGITI